MNESASPGTPLSNVSPGTIFASKKQRVQQSLWVRIVSGSSFLIATSRHVFHEFLQRLSEALYFWFLKHPMAMSSTIWEHFFFSLFSPFPLQTWCVVILLGILVLIFWGVADIHSLRVFFGLFVIFIDHCSTVKSFPEWRILISPRKKAALHVL